MRHLLTGVSAAALACIAGGALGQDAGQPALGGGERDAQEITCRDLSVMETATVPGVLYFIAGHREGSGAASGQDEEVAGMEDATAAQEGAVEDEPGTAVAGTEDDPAVDEVELGEGEADMDEAEVDLAEDEENGETEADENGEGETAEGGDDTAMPEAAADGEASPEMGLEPEVAEGEAAMDDVEVVRVRGHFQIPIEQTVIACAEDPDALVADVIDAQRQGGAAMEAEFEGDG